MLDYYSILQVMPSASDEVIKSAYKVLAKKYHPDSKNYSPEVCAEKIRELNTAYEVLSDESKRKQYDMEYQSCFSSKETTSFNNSQPNHSRHTSESVYSESTYDTEDTSTDFSSTEPHSKMFDFIKSVGRSINQEVQKNKQIIENAYLDGMLMDEYILVKRFKQSAGYRRMGYAKALEEKGLLTRDSDGNIVPTERFREYNY